MTGMEKIDAALARRAVLHRMVMPGHVCPWGLKALHLLKSNGYALPGFRSGWFRLRNWQKAFVATSDGERVLWLPTSRGRLWR